MKAADFWKQVYQVDRDDVEARRALLVAYKAAGKWKDYADILRLEVEAIPAEDVEGKLEGLRTSLKRSAPICGKMPW